MTYATRRRRNARRLPRDFGVWCAALALGAICAAGCGVVIGALAFNAARNLGII